MSMKTLGRVMLPYKLEKLSNGRYAVVNRDYNPIGQVDRREWVPYEPYALPIKKVTESVARRASSGQDADIKHIYLFDDRCNPWDSEENFKQYMKRLSALFRLKIK